MGQFKKLSTSGPTHPICRKAKQTNPKEKEWRGARAGQQECKDNKWKHMPLGPGTGECRGRSLKRLVEDTSRTQCLPVLPFGNCFIFLGMPFPRLQIETCCDFRRPFLLCHDSGSSSIECRGLEEIPGCFLSVAVISREESRVGSSVHVGCPPWPHAHHGATS